MAHTFFLPTKKNDMSDNLESALDNEIENAQLFIEFILQCKTDSLQLAKSRSSQYIPELVSELHQEISLADRSIPNEPAAPQTEINILQKIYNEYLTSFNSHVEQADVILQELLALKSNAQSKEPVDISVKFNTEDSPANKVYALVKQAFLAYQMLRLLVLYSKIRNTEQEWQEEKIREIEEFKRNIDDNLFAYKAVYEDNSAVLYTVEFINDFFALVTNIIQAIKIENKQINTIFIGQVMYALFEQLNISTPMLPDKPLRATARLLSQYEPWFVKLAHVITHFIRRQENSNHLDITSYLQQELASAKIKPPKIEHHLSMSLLGFDREGDKPTTKFSLQPPSKKGCCVIL